MHFQSLSTLMLFTLVSVSLAPAITVAAECPPKDTFVCTIAEGPDQGKELIVVKRPQRYDLKNGALYGSVMKKEAKAQIDEEPLAGSGHIYEFESRPGRHAYRFAELEQFNSATDLASVLKTAKRGSVTVLPNSGQGSYEFDGSPKRFLVCKEKYFIQLNPHANDRALTDADVCKLMGEAAPAASAPTVTPPGTQPAREKSKTTR
jgi:hypothetical protein